MPNAKAVSANPEAAPPRSNTDAANSGRIATRAPMLTKPLVNPATSSALYVGVRHAWRRRIFGFATGSGWEPGFGAVSAPTAIAAPATATP